MYLNPIFGNKKQKCRMAQRPENEPLESPLPRFDFDRDMERYQTNSIQFNQTRQNSTAFRNRLKQLSRNCNPNMTKSGHVYAICGRSEVAVDRISG